MTAVAMAADARVRERPVLFSGPMIRAILDGRKTQTRRVVKHIPPLGGPIGWCSAAQAEEPGWVSIVGDYRRFCPYGTPGHRLWVRETFAHSEEGTFYRATDPGWDDKGVVPDGGWRPSIHMPRWASRLTLEVTGVRVERLQAISEEDARAEGTLTPLGAAIVAATPHVTHRGAFSQLWDGINGKRPGCDWASNPWVWAISFRRLP